MTIYVGNLNHRASEQEVNELFSAYGPVKSVKIITDKFTQRSKGFAFVEMENTADAATAIQALNETEFLTRTVYVSEARPKTEDSSSRGGGNSYAKKSSYSNSNW